MQVWGPGGWNDIWHEVPPPRSSRVEGIAAACCERSRCFFVVIFGRGHASAFMYVLVWVHRMCEAGIGHTQTEQDIKLVWPEYNYHWPKCDNYYWGCVCVCVWLASLFCECVCVRCRISPRMSIIRQLMWPCSLPRRLSCYDDVTVAWERDFTLHYELHTCSCAHTAHRMRNGGSQRSWRQPQWCWNSEQCCYIIATKKKSYLFPSSLYSHWECSEAPVKVLVSRLVSLFHHPSIYLPLHMQGTVGMCSTLSEIDIYSVWGIW